MRDGELCHACDVGTVPSAAEAVGARQSSRQSVLKVLAPAKLGYGESVFDVRAWFSCSVSGCIAETATPIRTRVVASVRVLQRKSPQVVGRSRRERTEDRRAHERSRATPRIFSRPEWLTLRGTHHFATHSRATGDGDVQAQSAVALVVRSTRTVRKPSNLLRWLPLRISG